MLIEIKYVNIEGNWICFKSFFDVFFGGNFLNEVLQYFKSKLQFLEASLPFHQIGFVKGFGRDGRAWENAWTVLTKLWKFILLQLWNNQKKFHISLPLLRFLTRWKTELAIVESLRKQNCLVRKNRKNVWYLTPMKVEVMVVEVVEQITFDEGENKVVKITTIFYVPVKDLVLNNGSVLNCR